MKKKLCSETGSACVLSRDRSQRCNATVPWLREKQLGSHHAAGHGASEWRPVARLWRRTAGGCGRRRMLIEVHIADQWRENREGRMIEIDAMVFVIDDDA